MSVPGNRLPSQQILVDRLLSWPQVQARLSKYPAIARSFPESVLTARRDKPPYYCHYMAWCLGTRNNEDLFGRLESLLVNAELLPNWKHERSLLTGGEFSDFWSLVWQLQVAEYLCSQGTNVKWHSGGPDLAVDIGSVTLFVECYVYRKSFGVECFIEEVLGQVGNDLKVTRDTCLPFSMPNGAALSDELSMLFLPLVDAEGLEEKRRMAQLRYPLVLSSSSQSTLTISIEGPSVEAYDPQASSRSVGDPSRYLEVALREVAKAKSGKNSLNSHRPHVVLVNFLLSPDAQLALWRMQNLCHEPPRVKVGNDVEALAFAVVGIDRTLSRADLRLLFAAPQNHVCTAITVPLE